MLVERGMIVLERFVMREITWSGPCQNRAYQPGKHTPDTAGRLNVFRRILWLTVNGHDAQSIHVHTNRQHIRGEDDIHGSCLSSFPLRDVFAIFQNGIEFYLQLIELFGNVLTRNTGSQLINISYRSLIEARATHITHLHSVCTSLNVIFGKSSHASQLPQGIEISNDCHIGVGSLSKSLEKGLGGRQHSHIYTDQNGRSGTTRRTYSHITPSRFLLDWALNGKEIVFHIKAVRREYRHLSQKDVVYLFVSFTHRRRGSDHLRSDVLVTNLPCR